MHSWLYVYKIHLYVVIHEAEENSVAGNNRLNFNFLLIFRLNNIFG
ncbi:hypothetical protein SAMN05443549_103302 [Flavobacterium fluvii]|uniref:Uncharacterized protein n=1 Tax=Flavobacterium fluvii TaxID=468056 RepID=A0A1M5IZ64_9FLAO|nr:hypothetical protein SAMN05443549_103302 [Flavobacterium fluvii]